jgi:spore germination cell wall hydrolase CwlJ-like protein
MPRNDTVHRADRTLLVALAVILATCSATVGSAMGHRANLSSPRVVTVAAPVQPVDGAMAELIAAHRCLTEALYYEARSEGRAGEQAVAEVVFHRLQAGHHGRSVCSVIYQGAGRPGCQFSFACDGALARPREAAAWQKAERLAAGILTGAVSLNNATSGATHYHTVSVNPDWAGTKAMRQTIQIGKHVFYRDTVHARDS